MRSLLRYLVTNYAFLLFLLLEIISFVFIFNYNRYQKTRYLNSASSITAYVYSTSNSIVNYFGLTRINRELAEENARLKSLILADPHFIEVADSVYSDSIHADSLYKFVAARVTNNSVNKQNNYITLNKGSKHGIKPDQGIIGAEGLVGVVTRVSESYSVGLPILNSRWGVSTKFKNSGYYGRLVWEGRDYRFANLLEIPFHVEIAHGDTLVTSGFSSIFPAGIMVGTVQAFEQPEGENYYNITVKLATNFKALSFVEVFENLDKNEIKKLEKVAQDGANVN